MLNFFKSKRKTKSLIKEISHSPSPQTNVALRDLPILNGVDLVALSTPPQDINFSEWLAVNVFDFYNITNAIYALISPTCTELSCPTMCGVEDVVYRWPTPDGAVELSAPIYIEKLLSWINISLQTDDIFPFFIEKSLPGNFDSTASQILRRLLRVYVHIYYHHFQDIEAINFGSHFITAFAHLMLFVVQNSLISMDELGTFGPIVNIFFRDINLQ